MRQEVLIYGFLSFKMKMHLGLLKWGIAACFTNCKTLQNHKQVTNDGISQFGWVWFILHIFPNLLVFTPTFLSSLFSVLVGIYMFYCSIRVDCWKWQAQNWKGIDPCRKIRAVQRAGRLLGLYGGHIIKMAAAFLQRMSSWGKTFLCRGMCLLLGFGYSCMCVLQVGVLEWGWGMWLLLLSS